MKEECCTPSQVLLTFLTGVSLSLICMSAALQPCDLSKDSAHQQ